MGLEAARERAKECREGVVGEAILPVERHLLSGLIQGGPDESSLVYDHRPTLTLADLLGGVSVPAR